MTDELPFFDSERNNRGRDVLWLQVISQKKRSHGQTICFLNNRNIFLEGSEFFRSFILQEKRKFIISRNQRKRIINGKRTVFYFLELFEIHPQRIVFFKLVDNLSGLGRHHPIDLDIRVKLVFVLVD